MADPQSILQLGIEAARAGDKAHARELFRLVTREDPNNTQGWLWLAGVADDRAEKQSALEHVLQLDPNNQLARKGLDALGAGSTATAPVAAGTTPMASSAQTTPVTPVTADNQTTATPAKATPRGRDHRAGVYDDATPAGPPAAAATPAVAAAPTFNDDDYNLGDYQDRAPRDDEREPVVLVEDEEPRRHGFGAFIPMIIVLLLVLIGLWYVSRNFLGGNDPVATDGTGGDTAAVTTTAEAGASDGSGVAGAATDVGAQPSGAAVGTAGGSPASVADASNSPAPSDSTGTTDGGSPGPDSSPTGSAAPVDQAGAAPAGTGAEASPPAPEASPAAPEASPAAPVASPAAPVASAPAAEASPAAPVPQPDVAGANPAIVSNDQIITAGAWQFGNSIGGQSYSNVTANPYGGVPPSRGRYLIALITVANTSGQPAQIPDGFFVIKDAQGRTYDFNRAASVDYYNRLPGAGDYSADSQIPPGAPLGSVPLLFDVNTDATDLVLFSRENPNQGFLIRQNVQ